MNIHKLREKYAKAHAAYLRHKDTNKTNNIEAKFLPMAEEFLRANFDEVMPVGDCLLNYLGGDFIVRKGGDTYTVDLKVCQGYSGFHVMVDARRKDENGNWEHALNNKVTDLFLFINKSAIMLVPYQIIYDKVAKLRDDEMFHLNRDLYHTALKAEVLLNTQECMKCTRRKSEI